MGKKQYKIDGESIESYFDTNKSVEENCVFDFLMTVQNIHSPGLHKLNELLELEIPIDKINKDKELLSLLEKDINLQSASLGCRISNRDNASEEMANETVSLGAISVVSARIHQGIKRNQFNSTTELKQFFDENLSEYKAHQKYQSDIDIDRMTLVYKDDEGEKFITKEDLLSNKSLNLSNSQRNVISNYWNQSNATGALFYSRFLDSNGEQKINNQESRIDILIDASKGKCNIYNAQSSGVIDPDNPFKKSEFLSRGVLKLDISNLPETKLPGISSVKPKIEFYISESGATDISLDIPESIKTEINHNPYHEIYQSAARALVNYVAYGKEKDTSVKEKDTRIINSLKNEYGSYKYLNLIADLGEKNISNKNIKEFVQSEIKDVLNKEESIEPENLGKIMQAYCKITSDSKEKNKLAMELIDRVFKLEEGKVIDSKKVDNLAKYVENIVSPICKDKAEKSELRQNSKKFVREISRFSNGKLSFKENWRFYKNKILDVIGNLLKRTPKKSLEKEVFSKNFVGKIKEAAKKTRHEKQEAASMEEPIIKGKDIRTPSLNTEPPRKSTKTIGYKLRDAKDSVKHATKNNLETIKNAAKKARMKTRISVLKAADKINKGVSTTKVPFKQVNKIPKKIREAAKKTVLEALDKINNGVSTTKVPFKPNKKGKGKSR